VERRFHGMRESTPQLVYCKNVHICYRRTMPYHPAIIANALLKRGRERGYTIDHMKLQKLVFLVHAWRLAKQGEPAVNREAEAWDYGPVFTELYSKLRDQGREPIAHLIPTYDPATKTNKPFVPNYGDEKTWDVVNFVLDRYGKLSAGQLSNLSHERDGPWDQTRRKGDGIIPDELIRDYYREQSRLGTARI
jgi:uncharacterized phage-associated protein